MVVPNKTAASLSLTWPAAILRVCYGEFDAFGPSPWLEAPGWSFGRGRRCLPHMHGQKFVFCVCVCVCVCVCAKAAAAAAMFTACFLAWSLLLPPSLLLLACYFVHALQAEMHFTLD